MKKIEYYEEISVGKLAGKKAINRIFYLLGFLILLSSWFILSEIINNSTFLPSPVLVGRTMILFIMNGNIFRHILVSLLRIMVGYSLGSVVAISLGILMGLNNTINDICEPFIELFRPIPPYAYISIALLWFGIGFMGKVFIIFVGTFFVVLINTIMGVVEIDRKLIEAAKTLGGQKYFIVRKVIIPVSLPSILVGLRLGFGTAWLSLIAAEMVAASSGLGFLISDAREFVQTDVVIMGMVIIGLIGYAFSVMFGKFIDLSLKHRKKLQV
jgi:ABC-type nitrate/sulfonate/bicarbonate transport system permease component